MKFDRIVVSAIVVSAFSGSIGHAATLAFNCKGTLNGTEYAMKVYQGYGYEAEMILTTTPITGEPIVEKLPAKGSAYSECGSRANPCRVIQIAQYQTLNPAIDFTMISDATSEVGEGTLDIYDDGFGSPATEEIALKCLKIQK